MVSSIAEKLQHANQDTLKHQIQYQKPRADYIKAINKMILTEYYAEYQF